MIASSSSSAGLEPVEELGQGRDAQPAGEVVVERRDRLAEEGGVVGAFRASGDDPAASDLQVEPAGRWVVEGRRQPPRRAGRGVAFAHVGQPHESVRPA